MQCHHGTCCLHFVSSTLPPSDADFAPFTGISASSTLPFSPPLSFRVVTRPGAGKTEKDEIRQGRCHKCERWVNVEGVKKGEVKVRFVSFE